MKKHFQISKLGKRWLYSVIAGFILIFTSLLIVNIKVVNIMKNDKIKESEEIINTVRRSVDHSLLAIQASAAELMLNNQNIALQATSKKEAFTVSSVYRFSELMYNIRVANTLIDDIYVYYPNNDYIVGTEGSYCTKNYFLLKNHLEKEGYAVWKKNILETSETEFFFVKQSDGQQKLYFRQQIPISKSKDPLSILIISIDATEFARILDMNLPHDGSTSISVFTDEGELYQTREEERIPLEKEIKPLLAKNHGIGMHKIENNTFVGWCILSEYEKFSYVVVTEKLVLLNGIMQIRHLLIVGIIICTIAGLGVSLFLSFRHYKSTEKTILNLNEKILWSLKEEILLDILNQKMEEYDPIKGLFQTSGITLDYINYRIILCDVSFEKNKKIIQEWLIEAGTILEHECKSVDVVPALKKEMAIILLNYDQKGEELSIRVCEILESLSGEIIKKQISEEFMSIEQLVSIYDQTKSSFYHQDQKSKSVAIKDKDSIILYERWKKAISLKEYGEAKLMMKELFRDYVCLPKDNFIGLGRKYTVINYVLQAIENEENRNDKQIFDECIEQLKNCDCVEETEICLERILKNLEELNLNFTLKQKDRLANRIKKIIEENYNQNYLGLYYISEQVGVGTSYISKVFKDEYGIGVVEYMNRLRIVNAKKIMETNEMTIKEIAEKVGFTSDIHFIRIFKKYENMTPGVYRKMENNEKS